MACPQSLQKKPAQALCEPVKLWGEKRIDSDFFAQKSMFYIIVVQWVIHGNSQGLIL